MIRGLVNGHQVAAPPPASRKLGLAITQPIMLRLLSREKALCQNDLAHPNSSLPYGKGQVSRGPAGRRTAIGVLVTTLPITLRSLSRRKALDRTTRLWAKEGFRPWGEGGKSNNDLHPTGVRIIHEGSDGGAQSGDGKLERASKSADLMSASASKNVVSDHLPLRVMAIECPPGREAPVSGKRATPRYGKNCSPATEVGRVQPYGKTPRRS